MFQLFKKKNNADEQAACGGCRSCGGLLGRLGMNVRNWDYTLALAGNPNTGKSTVFNALTGLRQHTGNWPGKTVTRAEGGFTFEEKNYKLIDLPGTYSLLSASTDEEVARDFILFGQPDCVLIVIDATCVERNLNLVLQVLSITDRVVVLCNLMDEARRKEIAIDHRSLGRDLGVPVMPVIARTGEGLNEAIRMVSQVIRGEFVTRPHRIEVHGDIKQSLDQLVPLILKEYPNLPNAEWVAMRLLEGDESIRKAFLNGELSRIDHLPHGSRAEASATPGGSASVEGSS